MIPTRCPSCAGHVDPEWIGRTRDNPGRLVGFCPTCNVVLLEHPVVPVPPERADLA